MTEYRMSVGRDYNTATRYEFCIYLNEEIVAREGGFARSDAARRAGRRKAEQLPEPKLRAVRPIAPAMLAAIMDDTDAVAPADAERARQLIAMRLASPKRSGAGKPIEQQQDAAHLPLFVHANEPKFL